MEAGNNDAVLDTAGAESLHAEVEGLREDVTRIVGPIDLQLRVEELQYFLASSERRRQSQHEQIIRLQEGHAMGVSLLRQQLAAGREERDAEAQNEQDELEEHKRRLTVAKSKLIDTNIAADRAGREAAELADAILHVEAEVEELQLKLNTAQGELSELTAAEKSVAAERTELEAAIRQTSQTLTELEAANTAAAATTANKGMDTTDVTSLLAQMEQHIESLRAQVATKDTEIAQLRLIVQEECVARTGLLARLRSQQRLAAAARVQDNR